jgi:hypothetical protein
LMFSGEKVGGDCLDSLPETSIEVAAPRCTPPS